MSVRNAPMVTIALRLDPETRQKLEILAEATGHRRADLVAEAVRRFVDAEYAGLLAWRERNGGGKAEEDDKPPPPERWNIIV